MKRGVTKSGRENPGSTESISGNILLYFLWITRKRAEVLWQGVDKRLEDLLKELCETKGWELVSSEIEPDRVYIGVKATPDYSPRQIVFNLKRDTAILLRKEYQDLAKMPSLWNRETFISTIPLSKDQIMQYVIRKRRSRSSMG